MPHSDDTRDAESLKVTDKRIFTSEGELREEYKERVTPAESPLQTKRAEEPERAAEPGRGGEQPNDRGKTLRDTAGSPGTPFTTFAESLIVNAYMSLGMLRSPYQPQPSVDLAAARQMIDILSMLDEKTRGNLTAEETDFLTTHLGELKLRFVQKSKAV
ncbi:MAG TPA: DUF1844 domain-containing protein [Thermoanaerobaculia bacterium]|nr:DUF1844 domain-containing protein [Thermoanaerobaculia bacterium]